MLMGAATPKSSEQNDRSADPSAKTDVRRESGTNVPVISLDHPKPQAPQSLEGLDWRPKV